MSWIRNALLVVLVNLAILLVLVGVVAVLPPAINDASDLVRRLTRSGGDREERKDLPNYKDETWIGQYDAEAPELTTIYYDYIGWRRGEFEGETITVDREGYRRHDPSAGYQEAKVWFFGGSTMWGTGVKDDMTIPAYFQKQSGLASFNFGESAYTAHQSLNLLMKAYLSGARPTDVFFYDGVNEVLHKCRSELTFYSSSREGQIRERMENSKGKYFANTGRALAPTLEILGEIKRKALSEANVVEKQARYDCDTDSEKTEKIAAALIQDWTVAKQIVESNGGRFHAVLQPVSYIGDPNLSHLPSVERDRNLRRQYEVVYSEIARQLREKGFPSYDLTALFDGDDFVYIDFCHVSPNGNERIAATLQKMAGL